MTKRAAGKESGFTLVEMLIALTIFAMLTAAGVALLSVTARTQQTADRLLGELGELRALQALLTADLSLAVPRRRRDDRGEPAPAFSAAASGQPALLEFVRGGVEGSEGRSSLRRIAYRLRDGRLERLSFPHVDGAQTALSMTLLRGVRQIRLRYRDEEGGWQDEWVPTDAARLPKAVELVTDSEAHGLVRQLFVVGAAL